MGAYFTIFVNNQANTPISKLDAFTNFNAVWQRGIMKEIIQTLAFLGSVNIPVSQMFLSTQQDCTRAWYSVL